jgi:hypothetical protein
MKTTKKSSAKPKSTADNAVGKDILVNVILDRSGSMSSNRAETIAGYNAYLDGLKKDTDTNYSITLTQFDKPDTTPELTISYADKKLSEVPVLDEAGYQPRGWTPLYDAIGETIRRLEGKTNGRPVLSMIITDGHENASTEFNREQIKALIKSKEAEGWTFVFMGADIDSYSVASSVGVNLKNVANYAKENTMAAFSNLAANTMSYTAERKISGVRGQSLNEAFFSEQDRQSLVQPGYSSGLSSVSFTPVPNQTTQVIPSNIPDPAQAGAGKTFPRNWKVNE